MRRSRPPPPLAGSFGPDEVSWIVRCRLRGHPQTPACQAASCTSRSGTPASSAAEMNACRSVCRGSRSRELKRRGSRPNRAQAGDADVRAAARPEVIKCPICRSWQYRRPHPVRRRPGDAQISQIRAEREQSCPGIGRQPYRRQCARCSDTRADYPARRGPVTHQGARPEFGPGVTSSPRTSRSALTGCRRLPGAALDRRRCGVTIEASVPALIVRRDLAFTRQRPGRR